MVTTETIRAPHVVLHQAQGTLWLSFPRSWGFQAKTLTEEPLAPRSSLFLPLWFFDSPKPRRVLCTDTHTVLHTVLKAGPGFHFPNMVLLLVVVVVTAQY